MFFSYHTLLKFYHLILPIKIFLINNSGYGMVKQTIDTWLDSRYVGCDENSGLSLPDFQKVYATHLIGYFAIIFFYLIIRLLKNILSKSSYQNRTVLFQKTITRLFKSYKVVTLYYFFSPIALS